MPYEIKIKDVDTSETFKTTIEVDVINTELHKVKSKIRSDVK